MTPSTTTEKGRAGGPIAPPLGGIAPPLVINVVSGRQALMHTQEITTWWPD